MGFWPYFLHEYSSAGISAIFMLIAGILITFFTLDFLLLVIQLKLKTTIWRKKPTSRKFKTNLFLEQWHREEEDEPHLSAAASSTEWHLLLNDEEGRGGLPADDADMFVNRNPDDIECCRVVFSPSPDINEFEPEIVGEAEKVWLVVVVPWWGRGGNRKTGLGQ